MSAAHVNRWAGEKWRKTKTAMLFLTIQLHVLTDYVCSQVAPQQTTQNTAGWALTTSEKNQWLFCRHRTRVCVCLHNNLAYLDSFSSCIIYNSLVNKSLIFWKCARLWNSSCLLIWDSREYNSKTECDVCCCHMFVSQLITFNSFIFSCTLSITGLICI